MTEDDIYYCDICVLPSLAFNDPLFLLFVGRGPNLHVGLGYNLHNFYADEEPYQTVDHRYEHQDNRHFFVV